MVRHLFRSYLYPLTRVLPWPMVKKTGAPPLFFPFYHAISGDPPPHLRHLYPVGTPDRFKGDLQFLLENFRPARWEQVIGFAEGKPLPPGPPFFFLTFDDGLQEIASVVAPLLLERGLPAVFFINTAFTDNRQLFYRYQVSLIIDKVRQAETSETGGKSVSGAHNGKMASKKLIPYLKSLTYDDQEIIRQLASTWQVDIDRYLYTHQPYLTSEQVVLLHKQGFLIGSHSHDHPPFGRLTLAEMRDQVGKSFGFLEALGIRERIFAFPFSDDQVSSAFIRSLQQDFGVSLSFGTAGLKKEMFPFHFQRIAMENSDLHSAREILRAGFLAYRIRQLTGKIRIQRP